MDGDFELKLASNEISVVIASFHIQELLEKKALSCVQCSCLFVYQDGSEKVAVWL